MSNLLLRAGLRALVLCGLFSPVCALAMTCKVQGSGALTVNADLGSTVAVPASAPNGSVVWRSEPINLTLECYQDSPQAGDEEVFVYLNPANQLIGQGIRAGLSIDGVDYTQSNGRISTRRSVPRCVGEGEQACGRQVFPLSFSVFIEKFGPTPPSGVASHLLDYRLFQVDGGQGLNPLPQRNLNYVINHLSGVRFVACNAQLRIVPETVEFGRIPIENVVKGRVIERRPFALHTSRTCDTAFSLDARFKPVSGQLDGELLIPNGNDGVGIRLSRSESGATLPYNRLFHLADLLQETRGAVAAFDAELVWNQDRPRAGAFSAEVVVDLFYK